MPLFLLSVSAPTGAVVFVGVGETLRSRVTAPLLEMSTSTVAPGTGCGTGTVAPAIPDKILLLTVLATCLDTSGILVIGRMTVYSLAADCSSSTSKKSISVVILTPSIKEK